MRPARQPVEPARRWDREAAFFDREAASVVGIAPMDPRALERFGRRRLRPWHQKEYRIGLLGDLRGLHVLDVGCGNGVNSVLLALLGARVTGIDVSAGAIRVAEERARVDGVADRVEFVHSPLELFDPVPGSFDVIWCDSVLHHLLPELPAVMRRLAEIAAGHARLVAYEPVSRSRSLRRLRLALPVHTEATPDERPLEPEEIELVRRHLVDPRERDFAAAARLSRFVLRGKILERTAPWQRATIEALTRVDDAVLRWGPAKAAASRVVLHGRFR